MKVLSATVALSLFLVLPGAGVEPPRRVLILHSFGRDFSPFDAAAHEFRMELARLSTSPVEFLDASLEMARFDGEENEGPLTDFLDSLHRGREPDLVAAVGAPALFFWQRNQARLFPGAPMVLIGADKRRIPNLTGSDRIVSVHLDLHLPALASNVRRLLPATRHFYLVMGTAPVERFWEQECRREWPAVLPGVEFHWLSDRSLEEMKTELASVGEDSVIFFGILSRDAAGAPYEHEDALELLRDSCRAPMFGFSREQFGLGIVGGPLVEMRSLGREAAAAAARVFAGENPGSIQMPAIQLQDSVYDWRELRRWRIPVSRLPANAAISFRPPGLWETHRALVLATAAVVLLQSGLIWLLLAAKRRARESEANLRLATEAANVGLWSRHAEENDEFHVSGQWRTVFGLPGGGPLRADDLMERIHPDDRTLVSEAIQQAARSGGGFEIEHRILTKDGGVRWINSRGSVEGARTRGVSMDISERKLHENQLSALRGELAHLSRVHTLGELSGALAHELNQPLGSILSNAQAALRLLARDAADLGEVREILEDIVSEDRRAGDVIKRLRALLKRGETQPTLMPVSECFDEVLELMRAELISRGVTFTREIESPLPDVLADRVQIQQVLLNLITNAGDAMESRPPGERHLTLRAEAEADGKAVRLQVRDSGCGFSVPPEWLFEPFHTTKTQGLGIGLAICRTIVEAHHGRLWAEACQAGGAVFYVSLPAAGPAPV
jgi:C4-dicarboxylate-specific signal transduction histidine kinase